MIDPEGATMTTTGFLALMNSGEQVTAGSEAHQIMHAQSPSSLS